MAETAATASGGLYQKEPKVYPREADGRYARLRKLAVYILLGLFYGVCWLTWDGRQALLFDLPARKFYVFGWVFWPQDFVYLAALLIIAGLTLFFFTALAGRLWCGFACPQTVWTELFLWIERWVEGDRGKRIKLDNAPWSLSKFGRKATKQLLWITLGLWTGFTFVGYFTPVTELAGKVTSLSLGPWETWWIVFYGFATYGNAGFLREQVCKYMCPYARFQSAMFDHDTLIVSYDGARGEPRGSRKRGTDPATLDLGHCVDCTLCVQVCPTGIDIREGLQYECISCAACVDVCNSVMDRMDYPRGLIRFTTERALDHKPTRVLRPRTIIYATLLLGVVTALAASVVTRTPLRLEVLRDRNALYRVIDPQTVENVYSLRVINMEHTARRYRLTVSGVDQLQVDGQPDLDLAPGEAASVPLRLRAPRSAGNGRQEIGLTLSAESDDSISVRRQTTFFLPFEGASP